MEVCECRAICFCSHDRVVYMYGFALEERSTYERSSCKHEQKSCISQIMQLVHYTTHYTLYIE